MQYKKCILQLVWGAGAMFLMFLVSFQCFRLLFFDNNLFMDSCGKGDFVRVENGKLVHQKRLRPLNYLHV